MPTNLNDFKLRMSLNGMGGHELVEAGEQSTQNVDFVSMICLDNGNITYTDSMSGTTFTNMMIPEGITISGQIQNVSSPTLGGAKVLHYKEF